MSAAILEVIVCSVADAIEAQHGGASRLELVQNLEQGGLTPSFELVREIRDKVDLPLRVMVRESVGYDAQNEYEIEKLCLAANAFDSLRVDGLVLGYLNGGEVDVALCERILSHAPHSKATFHHAFEDAKDQLRALKAIKRLPQVHRVLSHGGSGSLIEKIGRFQKYQDVAAPEIEIIAGGGIDLNAITQIGRTTSIREFHVGRAVRNPPRVHGFVKAELVSKLVGVLREL
ncbi:MAG TPA: copper homeostasis protein CutC [Pyrinomonadaceae bacterium]